MLPTRDRIVTATFGDDTAASEKTRNVTQAKDAHQTQESRDSQGEENCVWERYFECFYKRRWLLGNSSSKSVFLASLFDPPRGYLRSLESVGYLPGRGVLWDRKHMCKEPKTWGTSRERRWRCSAALCPKAPEDTKSLYEILAARKKWPCPTQFLQALRDRFRRWIHLRETGDLQKKWWVFKNQHLKCSVYQPSPIDPYNDISHFMNLHLTPFFFFWM